MQSAFGDCGDQVPNASNWVFARVLLKSDLSSSEKVTAMKDACGELDKTAHLGKIFQRSQGIIDYLSSALWFEQVVLSKTIDAFSVLGGSDAQKEFKTALNEIKNHPDPVYRIRAVYDLVVKNQGNYRLKKDGTPDTGSQLASPGRTIDRARKTGAGGVCWDNANLLYWSLLQVARPSGQRNALGALDENSFSMDHVWGEDAKLGGHSWVRVNLPQRDAKGVLQFAQFDLDTTEHHEFVPLMPRFQRVSEPTRASNLSQCQQIQSCLQGEALPQPAPEAVDAAPERASSPP